MKSESNQSTPTESNKKPDAIKIARLVLNALNRGVDPQQISDSITGLAEDVLLSVLACMEWDRATIEQLALVSQLGANYAHIVGRTEFDPEIKRKILEEIRHQRSLIPRRSPEDTVFNKTLERAEAHNQRTLSGGGHIYDTIIVPRNE